MDQDLKSSNQPSSITPIDVHFSCQRCCQPLQLHSTLSNITEETILDLISKQNLVASKALQDDTKKETNDVNKSNKLEQKTSKIDPNVIYKTINSFKKLNSQDIEIENNSQLTSESITSSLLSGFNLSNTSDCKKDLNLQIQLFDILSDQSDIDHPLCEECADFVIEQMDKQLELLEKECNEIMRHKDEILSRDEASTSQEESIESLEAKIKELHETQVSLIKELKDLNNQQKDLSDQLERSKNELLQSKEGEKDYWNESNTVEFKYSRSLSDKNTLKAKVRQATDYHARLKKTNIFSLTFEIYEVAPFMTINGFRMGRLPDMQIEWNEINAGWGQCALLLYSLTRKLDSFQFQRFKVVPYGNFSFMKSLDDKSKQLPLYSSSGFKYYFNQKFDHAMVAFLDCLQQFLEEIQRQNKDFKLPYEMNSKGEIYEKNNSNLRFSIKTNINTEENWTKALRFMLINLKWILAWVTSKYGD